MIYKKRLGIGVSTALQLFVIDGTERIEEWYFKPYLRVKKPIYGQEIDLINFIADDRDEFEVENEKLSIQKCKIFRDNLSSWWK